MLKVVRRQATWKSSTCASVALSGRLDLDNRYWQSIYIFRAHSKDTCYSNVLPRGRELDATAAKARSLLPSPSHPMSSRVRSQSRPYPRLPANPKTSRDFSSSRALPACLRSDLAANLAPKPPTGIFTRFASPLISDLLLPGLGHLHTRCISPCHRGKRRGHRHMLRGTRAVE